METQVSTVPDDSATSDVVKSPERGPDNNTSGDALSIIRDMQTTLTRQNDRILSQIKGISFDIGNMKRDISKVTKIVSKLDSTRDRETYAANTLQCEFRTFSWKVVSTLRSIQGNDDLSDCVDGQWNEYFHGEESVLSNFYKTPLYVHGLEFKSAEHMYQYQKADFHGKDGDVGEEILHAPHGAAAKGVASRNIEVCPEWEEEKEEIMFGILCLKAEQCTEFADKLLATGNRPLIHDLPVYLWGWGTHGQGLNLMGRILERVRECMKNHSTSTIIANHFGPQQTQYDQENKTWETQPQEPLRKEDHRKHAPAIQEEWTKKSPKKKNRNSDSQAVNKRDPDTTELRTESVDDWPSLPRPGTKDSKRHVTSDDKSKSLQVEVMGDSQGQRQDHEGTDRRQQPHQRQDRGRGLPADRHGKGYGSRRGGGGYNNRDGRWHDKGNQYSEEQDKSTASSTHEQRNDTEYHEDAPTHTDRHGHTGGSGNRRGNSYRKQRDLGRSTDSPTSEQVNDPEYHDDTHTDRHGYTGGSRRGNSYRKQRDQGRSTDSPTSEQVNDPERHDDTHTDRHGHTGGSGNRRGNSYRKQRDQGGSTDSPTPEQVNDPERHDDTHTDRHGHTGGSGNRRGNSYQKQRDQGRSTDSPTPEQVNDPERHDDTHTRRPRHTGGRGNSRGGNSYYKQQELERSTDYTAQLNDPEQHDDPSTQSEERHRETNRGGRRGINRRSNQRGSRHNDYSSGEARGSKPHDYSSGESQGLPADRHGKGYGSRRGGGGYNNRDGRWHDKGNQYSEEQDKSTASSTHEQRNDTESYVAGGRRKAPSNNYDDQVYSHHQENPGDNSGQGRHEPREDSSNLPSDTGSPHTDLGMGVPPGFAKKETPVSRAIPITKVNEAGADRHVTLGQDQCKVTLDCHPAKNLVSE